MSRSARHRHSKSARNRIRVGRRVLGAGRRRGRGRGRRGADHDRPARPGSRTPPDWRASAAPRSVPAAGSVALSPRRPGPAQGTPPRARRAQALRRRLRPGPGRRDRPAGDVPVAGGDGMSRREPRFSSVHPASGSPTGSSAAPPIRGTLTVAADNVIIDAYGTGRYPVFSRTTAGNDLTVSGNADFISHIRLTGHGYQRVPGCGSAQHRRVRGRRRHRRPARHRRLREGLRQPVRGHLRRARRRLRHDQPQHLQRRQLAQPVEPRRRARSRS